VEDREEHAVRARRQAGAAQRVDHVVRGRKPVQAIEAHVVRAVRLPGRREITRRGIVDGGLARVRHQRDAARQGRRRPRDPGQRRRDPECFGDRAGRVPG